MESEKMISMITDRIFIGGLDDVNSEDKLKVLKELGITHVLSLLYNDQEEKKKLVNGKLKKVWSNLDSDALEAERELVYSIFRTLFIRFKEQSVPNYICPKGCRDCKSELEHIKCGLSFAEFELSQILFGDLDAKVFVHCMAGIDRAPFVVAKYLSMNNHPPGSLSGWSRREKNEHHNLKYKMTLQEAYSEIKKVRPQITEHYEWSE
jgi:hypothetical protein